jgi:hypothetical protein
MYDEYHWIAGRTRPSELFFGAPLMCLALGLRNPAEVDFITTTDYTRPEQVANVVQVLERGRIHYVVLWDFTLEIPEAGHAAGNHLGPLITYLETHYRVVKTFTNGDLVWERNE